MDEPSNQSSLPSQKISSSPGVVKSQCSGLRICLSATHVLYLRSSEDHGNTTMRQIIRSAYSYCHLNVDEWVEPEMPKMAIIGNNNNSSQIIAKVDNKMVTLSLYRNLSHIFAIFGNILLPKVAKNGNFYWVQSCQKWQMNIALLWTRYVWSTWCELKDLSQCSAVSLNAWDPPLP